MRFPKVRSACMAVITLACSLAISAAFAQTSASSGSMPGMEMPAAAGSQGDTPSTSAFQAADHAMMSGMSDVQYTGDADRDFVAHMIP
ncbi:MAG: DUF305 domain-containing protein, partial [Caballeronia sp.]